MNFAYWCHEFDIVNGGWFRTSSDLNGRTVQGLEVVLWLSRQLGQQHLTEHGLTQQTLDRWIRNIIVTQQIN